MESIAFAGKVLVLSDIRSSENVGSLFRTADAAGIEKIYLAGITPSPTDRFGRPVAAIAKTALGAQLSIAWEKVESIEDVLKKLKQEGYQLIAIEQSNQSVDYKNVSVKLPVAFILGNEVEGLLESAIEVADIVAEIPMQGKLARNRLPGDGGKESLNVAVAGGIALFRMLGL